MICETCHSLSCDTVQHHLYFSRAVYDVSSCVVVDSTPLPRKGARIVTACINRGDKSVPILVGVLRHLVATHLSLLCLSLRLGL